jgi:hypothetical protein
MLTLLLKRSVHFVVMMMLIAFSSCKKNSDKPAITVEYKITPMNQYFTSIKYNDNTGSPVTTSDLSQFANGVKDISISVKPFDAKLETQINNTTAQTITYSLAIVVDGQVVKLTQASAAPMQTGSSSVEYIIQ